jgi:hypothetical protein
MAAGLLNGDFCCFRTEKLGWFQWLWEVRRPGLIFFAAGVR